MTRDDASANVAREGPRVSVIMPAFNAGRCIARTIRSVQDGTEQDFEIVVVDDASTDDTCEVVRALAQADKRIRLIALESNGGPSRARNVAFEQARGAWLALLDADDAFRPERLRTLVDAAEAGGLDVIGDDIVLFDDAAQMEVGVYGLVKRPGLSRVTLDDYLRSTTYRVGLAEALFREDAPLSLVQPVMRAAFVRDHAIRYSERYRYCEDFLLGYDLLRHGARMALLGQAMYLYTEPLGSISRRSSPYSRTVADRQSVIDAVDEILARDGGLTAHQRRLLIARKRATAAALRYGRFRQNTAQCGKPALLKRILTQPGLWCRFARELRHGLASRRRYNAMYRQEPAAA